MITWEAIEHQGRGIYDQHYLEYLTRVVELAGEYGLYVIIDPHQVIYSPPVIPSSSHSYTIGLVVAAIPSLHLVNRRNRSYCFDYLILSYPLLYYHDRMCGVAQVEEMGPQDGR